MAEEARQHVFRRMIAAIRRRTSTAWWPLTVVLIVHPTLLALTATSMAAEGNPSDHPLRTGIISEEETEFVSNKCREAFVVAPVDREKVEPHVPERYRLAHVGSTDRVSVIVRAARCEEKGRVGHAEVTLEGSFQVHIEDPDGAPGDPSGQDAFNQYVFFWALNNRDAVNWLSGGARDPVFYVSDLAWTYEPVLGRADPNFAFSAPSPAPSPYEMSAVAAEPAPSEFPIRTDLWLDGPTGTSKVVVDIPQLRFGQATTTITPKSGTAMADILGNKSVHATTLFNTWESSTYERTSCSWEPPEEGSTTWKADC